MRSVFVTAPDDRTSLLLLFLR